jgi:hypothetical protein
MATPAHEIGRTILDRYFPRKPGPSDAALQAINVLLKDEWFLDQLQGLPGYHGSAAELMGTIQKNGLDARG